MNREVYPELEPVISSAQEMLHALQNPGMKTRMKNALRALKSGSPLGERDRIFWPAGLLLVGLAEAGQTGTVEQELSGWKKSGAPIQFPDDALTGFALLTAEDAAGERTYGQDVRRMAEFLYAAPKDAGQSILYNPHRGNEYIFADGAGQTAMFLSRYSVRYHDQEAGRLARRQLSEFREYGFDEAAGLPYHAYERSTRLCHGMIGWGRAAGWLMMGSSVYAADHPEDAGMRENFLSLEEALFRYQREDGGFGWQIPGIKGPAATSGSAMIGWAAAQAMQHGIGIPGLADRLTDLRVFLQSHIRDGRVLQAQGECVDFGMYRPQFGSFPWGQGAGLAFLARMDKHL